MIGMIVGVNKGVCDMLLDEICKELWTMRPYPKKIILGTRTFELLISQFKATGTYGLRVNLKGEYVRMFGMKIEVDESKKDWLQYVFEDCESEKD